LEMDSCPFPVGEFPPNPANSRRLPPPLRKVHTSPLFRHAFENTTFRSLKLVSGRSKQRT
jgi:hypothetical protein